MPSHEDGARPHAGGNVRPVRAPAFAVALHDVGGQLPHRHVGHEHALHRHRDVRGAQGLRLPALLPWETDVVEDGGKQAWKS